MYSFYSAPMMRADALTNCGMDYDADASTGPP